MSAIPVNGVSKGTYQPHARINLTACADIDCSLRQQDQALDSFFPQTYNLQTFLLSLQKQTSTSRYSKKFPSRPLGPRIVCTLDAYHLVERKFCLSVQKLGLFLMISNLWFGWLIRSNQTTSITAILRFYPKSEG